jgi:hypothetical protein
MDRLEDRSEVKSGGECYEIPQTKKSFSQNSHLSQKMAWAGMILNTTKSRTGHSIFLCYPISCQPCKAITVRVFHEVS